MSRAVSSSMGGAPCDVGALDEQQQFLAQAGLEHSHLPVREAEALGDVALRQAPGVTCGVEGPQRLRQARRDARASSLVPRARGVERCVLDLLKRDADAAPSGTNGKRTRWRW